jgi:hypothetical protein
MQISKSKPKKISILCTFNHDQCSTLPLPPPPVHCKKSQGEFVSDIPAGDGKIGNLFSQRRIFPAPCMTDESFYLCMTAGLKTICTTNGAKKNLHNIGFPDIFTINYCTYQRFVQSN